MNEIYISIPYDIRKLTDLQIALGGNKCSVQNLLLDTLETMYAQKVDPEFSSADTQDLSDGLKLDPRTVQVAAFKITQDGKQNYYESLTGNEILDVARILRLDITGHGSFMSNLRTSPIKVISAERYADLVALRDSNAGIVAGAFDIDFDRGIMDAQNIFTGWHSFLIHDVSTAVYYADQKTQKTESERLLKFLDFLLPRELEPGIDHKCNEEDGVPQESDSLSMQM